MFVAMCVYVCVHIYIHTASYYLFIQLYIYIYTHKILIFELCTLKPYNPQALNPYPLPLKPYLLIRGGHFGQARSWFNKAVEGKGFEIRCLVAAVYRFARIRFRGQCRGIVVSFCNPKPEAYISRRLQAGIEHTV